MLKPKLSICCITYNHSNFILDCLKGFESQIVDFEVEVVIHDDFSTDNTRELLLEYKKRSKFKVILLFPDHNRYSRGERVFLRTFKKSSGEYIAMCDGDDYWVDSYKLQKQVDFLEKNKEYVVCSHNAKIIDNNNKHIQNFKIPELFEDKTYSKLELKKGAHLLTLSMCFRNVIKEFPYEIHKVINGDTFLISILGQYGKGKYIQAITPAMYRVHVTGVWSMINELKKIEHRVLFYYYLKKYYVKRGDVEVVFDANYKVNYNYRELLIAYLQDGNIKKTIRFIYNWGVKNRLFLDKENYKFTKICIINYLKNKPLENYKS